MAASQRHLNEYEIVVAWQRKVSDAAVPFEARWTEAALRRTNPELYTRFREQRELFDEAVNDGPIDDFTIHGAAMVRAYVAVTRAMETAGAPDDAYLIGQGPAGLTIAIGPRPCCTRVRELYGDTVVWFTPDELAAVIEMDAHFKALAEVKVVFPGAEVAGWKPRDAPL